MSQQQHMDKIFQNFGTKNLKDRDDTHATEREVFTKESC